MIIEPNDSWDDFDNSDEENQSDNEDPKSLDEQEQLNSENLAQRIEEENEPGNEFNEETPDQMTPGEEAMSGFFERTNEFPDNLSVNDEKPLTRNLLGDNPPGSESAAFESGKVGDASAEQFKYDEENLIEGFRENLDKTEQQINLDKKLKDDDFTD